MARLSYDAHCAYSDDHLDHGQKIAGVSPEWASVAYFYSAYHSMKAALLDDPIFDDLGELKKLSPHLMTDSKYAHVHKVRNGQPGFGVNNLVHLLYPGKRQSYEKLHQSSLGVRYGQGVVYPVDQLESMASDIAEARRNGLLVASPL